MSLPKWHERRRVVSGPSLTTPQTAQTEGPPVAYSSLEDQSPEHPPFVLPLPPQNAPAETGFENGRSIYWPFTTQDEAFKFLDVEFSRTTRTSNSFSLTVASLTSVATQMSPSILKAYLTQLEVKYKTAIQPTINPSVDYSVSIRKLLRSLNSPKSGHDLATFVGEYYGYVFRFGYVFDDERSRTWIQVQLGVGNVGSRMYTRVRCGYHDIKGVALGMVVESPHLVVVVSPGGGVYFCKDENDETEDNDAIPYTFTRVFPSIEYVGLEARFVESEDQNVSIVHFD
jgi:hypothetical protein